MDYKMPIVDGVEATRKIEALLHQVAVIGFTFDEKSSPAVLAAGTDASFIQKDLSAHRQYLKDS